MEEFTEWELSLVTAHYPEYARPGDRKLYYQVEYKLPPGRIADWPEEENWVAEKLMSADELVADYWNLWKTKKEQGEEIEMPKPPNTIMRSRTRTTPKISKKVEKSSTKTTTPVTAKPTDDPSHNRRTKRTSTSGENKKKKPAKVDDTILNARSKCSSDAIRKDPSDYAAETAKILEAVRVKCEAIIKKDKQKKISNKSPLPENPKNRVVPKLVIKRSTLLKTAAKQPAKKASSKEIVPPTVPDVVHKVKKTKSDVSIAKVLKKPAAASGTIPRLIPKSKLEILKEQMAARVKQHAGIYKPKTELLREDKAPPPSKKTKLSWDTTAPPLTSIEPYAPSSPIRLVDAFGRVNLMMRESRRSRPGRALIQPLSVLAQATEDYDQNPFDADSHAHVESEMSLFEEEYHTVETFAMPYAPSSPVLFNDNSPEAPVLPTKEQRKVLSAYTPRSPVYKRYVSSNNTANVPEQNSVLDEDSIPIPAFVEFLKFKDAPAAHPFFKVLARFGAECWLTDIDALATLKPVLVIATLKGNDDVELCMTLFENEPGSRPSHLCRCIPSEKLAVDHSYLIEEAIERIRAQMSY